MIRVSVVGRRAEYLRGSAFGIGILLIILTLADRTHGMFENCQYPQTQFDPEFEVQKYGTPTAFVSTKSIGISPYSLMDPYRQSTLYHEYLLIGPGIENSEKGLIPHGVQTDETTEEIKLNLFDGTGTHYWDNEPNLVQHNLGKEYNWALINATGMLPSLTVVNTTFEQTFAFHSDGGDIISYHLQYPHLFRSRTTVPPLDVLIEFPAKTKTLLSLHTMIDYQTFGLLRWRLTPADPVTFVDLQQQYEFERPNAFPMGCDGKPDDNFELDPEISYYSMLCINQKRFSRIENPCIKDMFLFYIIRGKPPMLGSPDTYRSPPSLFIITPMVYELLSFRGWLDLTEVYCSRPDDPEECGNPLDIVLTNDHLLIHTDKGLYVSSSLNESNANVSLPYSLKPLLKFMPIDPCANFNELNCSEVLNCVRYEIASPILYQQSIKRQRLFYTPVCHLYQYPIYDDIVILVIEHLTQTPNMSAELDVVTVLYAAKPYDDWLLLFQEQHKYRTREGREVPIKELIGIFFNHHRRHFDISLLLNDNGKERTIRFVLPIPEVEHNRFSGYEELDGLLGNGILEYEFPEVFHLTSVTVNPAPLDVYFLGNQLYIAEAGGAFVYLSVPATYNHNKEESYFNYCSFNHPDRSYVCTEKTHFEIYVGRVGVNYSPIGVDYRKIIELKYTMLYNLWPFKYRQYITLLGHFTAGYSGKVMFWYMYDHNQLVKEQRGLKTLNGTKMCEDEDADEQAVKCHICKGLKNKEEVYKCNLTDLHADDYNLVFRMISFDPKIMPVREISTHGPLVPFLVDGDKVLVFEADVPNLSGYKPFSNYLQDINVGNRILCPNHNPVNQSNQNSTQCPEITSSESVSLCELYIRHMKPLHDSSNVNYNYKYLDGFRQSFYATIVKPFPLDPIPTALVVVVERATNHAIIQIDDSQFEGNGFRFTYKHIGQTLYIPQFMSVLLTGFPQYEECTAKASAKHKMNRMVGYATRYYRQGKRAQIEPFKSFFIDFSTPHYCKYYDKTFEQLSENCTVKDTTADEFEKRRNNLNKQRIESNKEHEDLINTINKVWEATFKPASTEEEGPLFQPLEALDPPTYEEMEEAHLTIRHQGQTLRSYVDGPSTKVKLENPVPVDTIQNFKCPEQPIWQIADGGCHLQLYLVKHPVLKQSGGRISLDKHDSLSFTLKLRSLTPLGKSLTHRSLLTVTNTNPDVLTVDKKDVIGKDPQVMHITLTPTGLRKGVATVTVRPLIISTICPFADGSFTLIVQVQRLEGRRLYVNYPIPICKAETDRDDEERPWKVDLPSCVPRSELKMKNIIRRPDTEYGPIFYSSLPVNYRPPSTRGSEIPTSNNVYNADPAEHNYKDWYRVSKHTGDLDQCDGKAKRDECTCTGDDEFKDDDIYTDCKRMVYNAKRNTKVDISVEYDRIMKDEYQHAEFFSSKQNWTISVEEINNRTEFTLASLSSKYLDAVHDDETLHEGVQYHDARTLSVTLHGTGLFHFKVSLGQFESFDKVSGFFMIFCSENALNHVQLVVIMLLTIAVCMVLVFCGFLVVRSRLASQLPYKTLDRNKIKME